MISKYIEVGNKVDIRILQEVMRGFDNPSKPKVYKSQIHEIISEDEIQLVMPIEGSKLVVLQTDIRYDLCFYTSTGLYTCDAVITDRMKDGNIYVVTAKITSELSKYQRREYYRIETLLDFDYYLPEEEEEFTPQLLEELADKYDRGRLAVKLNKGVIVDISGGGVRAVTDKPIQEGKSVLLFFHFEYNNRIQAMEVVGNVIKCDKSAKAIDEKYEIRLEYSQITKNAREIVIRYIFEEDRKKRKNDRI